MWDKDQFAAHLAKGEVQWGRVGGAQGLGGEKIVCTTYFLEVNGKGENMPEGVGVEHGSAWLCEWGGGGGK